MRPGIAFPTPALAGALVGLSLFGCTKAEDAAETEIDKAEAAIERTLQLDGKEIVNPPTIASKDGVLEWTMTAAPSEVTVAGKTFISNVYNGAYIPPVLRVRRGDELRLTLVNNIDKADIEVDGPEATNVHYHGMGISPNEPADNPYISVPSSKGAVSAELKAMYSFEPALLKTSPTYEYRWSVPPEHPQGLYWFHPHPHGKNTEAQILSGLSAVLVIDGLFEEHYPELAVAEHRTLILKDIDLPGAKDGDPKTKTINGIAGGAFRTRPGEVEIWEIGNIGADAFFDFAVDGHKMWVIGRDGNILTQPEEVVNVFIPPSSRAVVAIQARGPGEYGVRSLEVDTGPAGDPNPEVQLATFVVEGTAVDNASLVSRLQQPAAKPETITPSVASLRKAKIARKRTLVYTESADGNSFFIDGKAYDMSRIDVETTLGDVEEWTIVNDTDERHTFHIHQIDYLVTEINGDDEDTTGLRDNIDVPYRDQVTKKPGSVKLILPFDDPLIVGKFLAHCHISEHSDSGMMVNVLVKPKSVS